MYLAMALKLWREILICLLALLLAGSLFLFYNAMQSMKLMKVNHSLETANYIAAYEARARAIEQQNYQGVIDAINKAKLQQQAIAIDVRSANNANERLHQTIDQLTANTTNNASARAEYTTAVSKLFKDCSSAYIEMARAADGHASDVRLLKDARR